MSTLRYAGYIRVSTREQAKGYSLDAQRKAVEGWVNERGGQYARTYMDAGYSGQNINRPAFMRMCFDIRAGRIDAIVVHAWDRFGRNPVENLVIKALLRNEYGVKIYCVREPSSDESDDDLMGVMLEAVAELASEWYSKKVSEEISKGRREKHAQGYHLGTPPFGYHRENCHAYT